MKGYYHYCSKGFKSEILFNSVEEFVAGINRIAVCVALSLKQGMPVVVLAYCLMDNHFHFILYGTESDCDSFASNYKKLTSMWVVEHRGQPLAEHIDVGHWFIPPYKLAEKIVYVLRNPVAAGLRVTPQGYRWSSAFLMFSDWSPVAATSVRDMSVRHIQKLCSSRVTLPNDWLIVDGMIWPGSFVAIASAEKPFNTIGNFMFDLNNGKIDRETEEEMMAESFSLPDSELRIRAVQLGIEFFRKEKISRCTPEERLKLARLLRNELKCNAKQLARVLHLNPEELQFLV